MSILIEPKSQENCAANSQNSSTQVSNLQHFRDAGWPLECVIPLLPWNAADFPVKDRGKAPAVPVQAGDPKACRLTNWQHGVTLSVLEDADACGFNFGLLLPIEHVGRKLLAIDVDTIVTPDEKFESCGLTEDDFVGIARSISDIAYAAFEGFTGSRIGDARPSKAARPSLYRYRPPRTWTG